MKSVWFACVCFILIACQGNTQEKISLKTSLDSVSYCIGTDIGKTLKTQGIEINASALTQGVRDATDSGKITLNEETIASVMTRFRRDLTIKQQEKTKTLGDKNKKDGEAFLAANKSKEGVKTTATGLQYKVLKEGSGAKPAATQSVTVNYRGTLTDGTEFDSSYKRGEPTSLPLNRFIKGWTEGVQLMSVGAKYQFFIPGELAYGRQPPTPAIPPDATLIFEVELISIQ